MVVYVGEVYKAANQKKQWIFVTDGSVSDLHLETSSSKSLLAISFCSPSIDQDSYAPVNHNLAGSTVSTCSVYSEILFALHTGHYEGNNDDTHAHFGNKKEDYGFFIELVILHIMQIGFCNLIKRERDQLNHLWVAEATENSTYFYSYDHLLASHLKDAAATAQKWANISSSVCIFGMSIFFVMMLLLLKLLFILLCADH